MALSASTLSGLIETNLKAKVPFYLPENAAGLKDFCDAIADAIVTHIVTDSELLPVTTDQGPAGAGIITGKVM